MVSKRWSENPSQKVLFSLYVRYPVSSANSFYLKRTISQWMDYSPRSIQQVLETPRRVQTANSSQRELKPTKCSTPLCSCGSGHPANPNVISQHSRINQFTTVKVRLRVCVYLTSTSDERLFYSSADKHNWNVNPVQCKNKQLSSKPKTWRRCENMEAFLFNRIINRTDWLQVGEDFSELWMNWNGKPRRRRMPTDLCDMKDMQLTPRVGISTHRFIKGTFWSGCDRCT